MRVQLMREREESEKGNSIKLKTNSHHDSIIKKNNKRILCVKLSKMGYERKNLVSLPKQKHEKKILIIQVNQKGAVKNMSPIS